MNRYICTTCGRWCYSAASPDSLINGRCPQPDCAGYTVPDPEVAAGSHTADTRLAEIRARCEAATPGPWEVATRGNTVQSHAVTTADKYLNIASSISPKTANANFIAHAREDIPAMLAEIERLTAAQPVWIPVSERLPEQVCDDSSADCLIAIRYNYDLPNEKPSLCTGYLLDGEWWAYMDHNCHRISDGDVVTHWMPLPEAPEEGEA